MTASAIAELASMFSFAGPDASGPDPHPRSASAASRSSAGSASASASSALSASLSCPARLASTPLMLACQAGESPTAFDATLGVAFACDEAGMFSGLSLHPTARFGSEGQTRLPGGIVNKVRSTRLLDVGRWLSALHAPVLLLFCLLFSACRQTEAPGELRRLEAHGLQLETPAGWTGGEAGGTYEYHSPDGAGRVRIARLEGAISVTGLKDAQMLAGTGTTPSSRPFPLSPTKIGGLPALRARYGTKDGHLYEVIALQLAAQASGPTSVVLIQICVAVDGVDRPESAAEKIIGSIRQSIRPLEGGSGLPDGGSLPSNSNLAPLDRPSPPPQPPQPSQAP